MNGELLAFPAISSENPIPMHTAKAGVATMLESLLDESSLEDMEYHLYVLEKIKRGTERATTEGALTHDEAKQRLGKWLAV